MSAGTAKKKATPTRTRKEAAVANLAANAPMLTEEEMDDLLRRVNPDGPINEDGSITPVSIGRRGALPNQLVKIFDADGRDFFIPERPPAMLTMQFMRDARNPRVGKDQATENFLLDLIGAEACEILRTDRRVTEEDVADIFTIVGRVAFGAIRRMQEAMDSGNS